ncbi:hypothetical protein OE88DRAFT_1659911 [Heliocybe sulcata]|uniref:Uncharacterized protein n=1 Tax=Heliocybe sulcata TaxID=5364 RepID=A0A5C3N0K2_9AGAM|nr:hypothetical protein OE88DRAFT_1659911 [Heliocybe sulcata]
MPLSKIPLLVMALLGLHAGLERPNPPPPPEERHLTNHVSQRIDFTFGPFFIKVGIPLLLDRREANRTTRRP